MKRFFQWLWRLIVPAPKPSGSIEQRFRERCLEYFASHPKAKDDVLKAWYAYHAPHFRVITEAPLHNFTNSLRWSKCVWCGRSREMVRWDDLPAQCQCRPVIRETSDVLREEAIKAFALTEKAQTQVPKLVEKMGMSGETLAVLHHTYGHDPETVASVVDVPPQLIAEYNAAMERESERSRTAMRKTVISAGS